MSEKLVITALGCAILNSVQDELGRGNKTNTEFYGFIEADSVDMWWDNSTKEQRHSIGCLLVDYDIMSANALWDSKSNFKDLAVKQQRRIKAGFKIRHWPYRMFDLGAMMGLNRI